MSKNSHFAAAVVLCLMVLAATFSPSAADSNCSDRCKAAYGACYKLSQERARCQAQMQRCLQACLNSKKKQRGAQATP